VRLTGWGPVRRGLRYERSVGGRPSSGLSPSAEPWGGLCGRRLEHVVVDGDAGSVGKQLAGVVEDDHAVAQQPPPLFGVVGDQTRRVVI